MNGSSSRNSQKCYVAFVDKETGVMKKLTTFAVMGSLLLALAACNTVKGVGRDIQSVGEAGDKAM